MRGFLLGLSPFVVLAWLGLVSTPSQAQEYGKLYLAVDSKAPVFELFLGYRGSFSNPYFNTHGATASARAYVYRRIAFVDIEGVYFHPKANRMNDEIRSLLDDQGLDALLYQPEFGWVARAGVTMLSGLLNFFTVAVVPFDLSLSAGSGRASYVEESSRFFLASQLDFTAYVTPRFGVGSGFLFQSEKSSTLGWVNNFDIFLRSSVRFF
jgi:hypothetical protein